MAPPRNPVHHRDERPVLDLLRPLLRLPAQHSVGAWYRHDHREGGQRPDLDLHLHQGGLQQGSSSTSLFVSTYQAHD